MVANDIFICSGVIKIFLKNICVFSIPFYANKSVLNATHWPFTCRLKRPPVLNLSLACQLCGCSSNSLTFVDLLMFSLSFTQLLQMFTKK